MEPFMGGMGSWQVATERGTNTSIELASMYRKLSGIANCISLCACGMHNYELTWIPAWKVSWVGVPAHVWWAHWSPQALRKKPRITTVQYLWAYYCTHKLNNWTIYRWGGVSTASWMKHQAKYDQLYIKEIKVVQFLYDILHAVSWHLNY